MQADLWKKVEELFQAVQAQPPDKRADFLNQACPDDPEVRGEVQSLLDAAPGAASFLDSSPLSSALPPGVKLGHFEILGSLGRGGMGEVYRARDSRLRREVAIKVLPVSFARDPDRIARFEREARAASALNHPNIVSVYDIGRENSTYWIVSELVDGETLRRRIDRGPLPARKAIEIGVQIAEGLAAAHAAGVIHRDLKPGNIMLNRDGRVKIVDFGLARQDRVLGAESSTIEVSQPGLILGTAGYMSPEQVRGAPTDARSDLFSLGLILYEMASGKRAFSGNSSIEVMNAILKDDPPELTPPSPPALGRIVLRCIEKQPARRFQSAADLGFALNSLSAPLLPGASPKNRVWLKWAVIAALGLVAAGASYRWLLRWQIPAPVEDRITRRLTYDSGLTTDGVISADGKLVAYASDRENAENLDIFVRQVDGGGLIRITDDPAKDWDPAFSPDGTQIAWRSERQEPGIYVAPSLGGDARLVVPQGHRPRFSPDGRSLMYWTGPENSGDITGSSEVKFWVQSASGGATAQIGTGCRLFENTPVWSPDSTRILFLGTCGQELVARRSWTENFGLTAWVSTADGKRLTPNRDLYGVWRSVHPEPKISQWITDPPRVLIPMPVGDTIHLIAVPVSTDGTRVTGAPHMLTSGSGAETQASASLEGRIVLSSDTWEEHIWSLPIDQNGNAAGLPKQETFGPAQQYGFGLSRNGMRLAYSSDRVNGRRLFYKDLETGREKELSTDGYRVEGPVFNHDGTRIMCTWWPRREGWLNFIYEVSVSGGVPRKIWDGVGFAALIDWAPDDKTLLFFTDQDFTKGVIRQLDLQSLSATMFLQDSEFSLWQGHFSKDGRWVTFCASEDGKSSRIYVVPFRKALVPRNEWIPITDGNWDDKPRFSYDEKLIFFTSNRDGFRCLWAQKVSSKMRRMGAPFAVYHFHQRRNSLEHGTDVGGSEIAVGPNLILFSNVQHVGNIWLLERAKELATR